MQYHDLISDAPFEDLPITLPSELKSDEDFALLFQYIISDFNIAINTYQAVYGYGDRQRLLASILKSLKDIMPIVDPDYIDDFPASLPKIEQLVARVIVMSQEFTGMHPEEEAV